MGIFIDINYENSNVVSNSVNIPYEKFENIDIAFDLVYNPCETEFLKTFKEL